ncbi:hypothetical protein FXB39_17475 [Nocardioides sp. BGMRC 2183]|nr:hypothetical protein FXB39_17475 [Nocardioides sp. BGMRC 2183]
MAFDVGGGGGGGSTSAIDRLDPLISDLIDLIGQLAGNEAVWDLLDGQDEQELSDGWTREPGHFTVPGTYGFDTPALYVAMHMSHPDWDTSEVTNADRERILQDAITEVWNDAHDSWVDSAVPTVYRTASQNVWEPDPGPIATSTTLLGTLRQWLYRQVSSDAGWVEPGTADAPDWLTNLQKHWPTTSESSESFCAFWNDVNDKCGLYLHAVSRLEVTCARIAATISDYQTNLVEVAGLARDRAREALRQWQAWKDSSGAWPTGAMEDNPDKAVFGNLSYALGVIGLFATGPAGFAAGLFSVATGTMVYIVDDKSVVSEVMQAVVSDDLHDGFLDDIKTISANMTAVLDQLHTAAPEDGSSTGSESLQAYVADVMSSHSDWSPPQVAL